MDPQLPTQHEYTTRFMCRLSPRDRVWGDPHDVEDAYVAALDALDALPTDPLETAKPHYVPFRAFMVLIGGPDTIMRRKFLTRALRRYEEERNVQLLRPVAHGDHVGYLHVNVAAIRYIQAEDTHPEQ